MTDSGSPAATGPGGPANKALPAPAEVSGRKRESEKGPSRHSTNEEWSDAHCQFAYFLHLYIRDFIKFADQKAAFVLAVTSAILTFLVKQGAQKSLLAPLGNRGFSDWSAFFACLFVGLGAFMALLAVLPRLRGKPHGIVYWGAFLSLGDASAYKAALQPLDENHLVSAVLEHCYELAEITDRKYELLKWAAWLGALGAVAAAFVLLGI